MVVLAPNPRILCRDLYSKDQHHQPPFNGGGCASVSVIGRGWAAPAGGGRRSARGEVKALGAFWDVARPSSIEMEPIASVDELDLALRQSQELAQPILIDWMANWCRKCIYLKPKLEKLAAEYHPRMKFYFVDVNKVSQALVKRGNISKMPTIQLWKDGEWKAEIIGGHKAWLVMDEVREMIQKFL